MTDWREAGRKADAHRIRDLYRGGFQAPAKSVARGRVSEAFRNVGATTVLDLWGGGTSARELVAAGFRVISVDNGSMEINDRGSVVTASRKRRALEFDAIEGGFESRWGSVRKFASEADAAFLDFCGPWTREARRAVEACRHMKAIVVTLVPDHNLQSDGTDDIERIVHNEWNIRLAFAARRNLTEARKVRVRRFLRYRREFGHPVYVFLASYDLITVEPIANTTRMRILDPLRRARYNAKSLAKYHALAPEQKLARSKVAYASRKQRLGDPTYRQSLRAYTRHRLHSRSSNPMPSRWMDCPLCETGRAPEATRPVS